MKEKYSVKTYGTSEYVICLCLDINGFQKDIFVVDEIYDYEEQKRVHGLIVAIADALNDARKEYPTLDVPSFFRSSDLDSRCDNANN